MDQPSIKDVENDIYDFIENSILVEHSKHDFDLKFLKRNLKTLKGVYHLNTLQLSKELYPNAEEYGLLEIAQFLDIESVDSNSHHHALEDAIVCAKILLEIISDLSQISLHSLEDIANTFKIPVLK